MFGQTPVQYNATFTAVHVMNGHGIMEYGWNTNDQTLPDAATSMVRIYNRAMRRWECMYMTNRFNNILYFGGTKEGKKIVLYLFEANTADNISYFTFEKMFKDSYKWNAQSSTDRGKTWRTTWTIKANRKKS